MSDTIDNVRSWAEDHKAVALGAVGVTLFGLLFIGWRRHRANAAGATSGATAATIGSSFTSTPYADTSGGGGTGAVDLSGLNDTINNLGGTITTAIGGLDIPGQTAATTAGFTGLTGLTTTTNQNLDSLTEAVTGLSSTILGNTVPTPGAAGSGATTGATAGPTAPPVPTSKPGPMSPVPPRSAPPRPVVKPKPVPAGHPVAKPIPPKPVVKVATKPKATPKPAPARTQAVKSGDNLSKIAKQNHETLAQLIAKNPQTKAHPNSIRPGQILKV